MQTCPVSWRCDKVTRWLDIPLNSAIDKAAAALLKNAALTLSACTRPDCLDITLTSQRNEGGHERSPASSSLFPDGVLAQKNMFDIPNKHSRWPKRLLFEHFHLCYFNKCFHLLCLTQSASELGQKTIISDKND